MRPSIVTDVALQEGSPLPVSPSAQFSIAPNNNLETSAAAEDTSKAWPPVRRAHPKERLIQLSPSTPDDQVEIRLEY